MPRGEFRHRYRFFADTPNVAWTIEIDTLEYQQTEKIEAELKRR